MPTTKLTQNFTNAVAHACDFHKNQTRKGGLIKVPYACHLLQVSGLVIEYGGSETHAIAAIFHDAIEDVGVTYQWISDNYGYAVAEIVQGCTHEKIDKTLPAEKWPTLIKEKRLQLFEFLKTAPEGIIRVSTADKLHNIASLLKDVRERGLDAFTAFKGGTEGTLWYFERLIDVFMQSQFDFARKIALAMEDHLVVIKQIIAKA